VNIFTIILKTNISIDKGVNKLKKFFITLLTSLFIIPQAGFADHNVFVPGHHRSDGTFVRPHIKKSPDGSRANNYGPSQKSSELMQPQNRDYDKNSIPNYRGSDDDSDGVHDNFDKKQYGR